MTQKDYRLLEAVIIGCIRYRQALPHGKQKLKQADGSVLYRAPYVAPSKILKPINRV